MRTTECKFPIFVKYLTKGDRDIYTQASCIGILLSLQVLNTLQEVCATPLANYQTWTMITIIMSVTRRATADKKHAHACIYHGLWIIIGLDSTIGGDVSQLVNASKLHRCSFAITNYNKLQGTWATTRINRQAWTMTTTIRPMIKMAAVVTRKRPYMNFPMALNKNGAEFKHRWWPVTNWECKQTVSMLQPPSGRWPKGL